jgi:hypothetical protein
MCRIIACLSELIAIVTQIEYFAFGARTIYATLVPIMENTCLTSHGNMDPGGCLSCRYYIQRCLHPHLMSMVQCFPGSVPKRMNIMYDPLESYNVRLNINSLCKDQSLHHLCYIQSLHHLCYIQRRLGCISENGDIGEYTPTIISSLWYVHLTSVARKSLYLRDVDIMCLISGTKESSVHGQLTQC